MTHYLIHMQSGIVMAVKTFPSEFQAMEAFLDAAANRGVLEVSEEVLNSGHLDIGEETLFWGMLNAHVI